jgi:oxalate decarboxylase family bicupin protein
MDRQHSSFISCVRILSLASCLQAIYALPAPQSSSSAPGVWAGPAGDDESNTGLPLRGSSTLLGQIPDEVNPTDSGDVPQSSYQLAPGQGAAADIGIPFIFKDTLNPQPIRGDLGATDPGPRTYGYDRLNPDTLAPPASDSGEVAQGKWPLGLSHNRIQPGNAGWSRQENTAVLPAATAMAGVDMKLSPGAYRELHWHKVNQIPRHIAGEENLDLTTIQANEWSLVLNGSVRVQTMNEDGQTFVDDLTTGDVWFFPAGVPHTLQALDDGVEFMLVFDDGSFDDSGTGLISEMFLRNPKEVLSKNFDVPLSDFDELPQDQLYIFNGTPAPANLSMQNVTGPGGVASGAQSYTYHFSKQEAYEVPGGSIKIIDPQTFPIATMFSVALVTIHPGAMREIHWYVLFIGSISRFFTKDVSKPVCLLTCYPHLGTVLATSGASFSPAVRESVCMQRRRRGQLSISPPAMSVTYPPRPHTTSRIPVMRMLSSSKSSRHLDSRISR